MQLNSECLDLDDGEIKAFPLKKNKKSDILVPKETIAITMVDREALKTNNFEDSKLRTKIERVIFVPYLRKGDKVLIFKPILLPLENKIMCDNIKKDYCNIQKHLLDKNELRSNIGEYIQCRTKGTGRLNNQPASEKLDKPTLSIPTNSTSRAFYFKTSYIREYILPNIKYDDELNKLINSVLN